MTNRPGTSTAPPAKKTAKKTAAKKTTAKRTTAPAKTATPKTTKPGPTLVDLRDPLPVRRRNFVGPCTPTETAAARAALASAALQLPIPVRTWNGSTAQLTDGTLLIHNPGPDRTFTAHIACRHGAIHGYPIRSLRDLGEARAITRACARPHGCVNADQAITNGVSTIPPKPDPVLALREGIRRAADTQPLTADEIAAGLAVRADNDQMKEHPEP
jgi:hypothetical protein